MHKITAWVITIIGATGFFYFAFRTIFFFISPEIITTIPYDEIGVGFARAGILVFDIALLIFSLMVFSFGASTLKKMKPELLENPIRKKGLNIYEVIMYICIVLLSIPIIFILLSLTPLNKLV